jgi:hypothetical protein
MVALLIAAVATFGASTQNADALGGFLKNKAKNSARNEVKGQVTKEEAQSNDQAATTQAKKPESSEPVVYENARYHYTITYPGNWELKDEDPKKATVQFIDTWGKLGNASMTSTWMSDDFPVDPAFKALVDQAEQRKKHDEVSEYYVKEYTSKGPKGETIKGVVMIESDIDPDMKRMQWQGYGGGNYYNFTASTNVEKFPMYKDTFNEMIESLEFNFPAK